MNDVGHKDYSFLENNDEKFAKNKERVVKVDFDATVHTGLDWEFKPQQKYIMVSPGETALAFYRAKNLTDRPVIGASVYAVIPYDAGIYFNKIQCFCFDEQLINPNEEVDLPILFYIDPEFGLDSRVAHINTITLCYVFFESDSEVPEEYQELLALKDAQVAKRRLGEDVVNVAKDSSGKNLDGRKILEGNRGQAINMGEIAIGGKNVQEAKKVVSAAA